MKSVIVCCSTHHGNTKKLVDAIAAEHEVTLIDATKVLEADLSEYDLIGFASGIYGFNYHESMQKFAEKNLPENKKVFCMYTCAMLKQGYTKNILKIIEGRNGTYLGEFGCNGYNTFGPFKLVGGTSKGHPDQIDLNNAVQFYKGLIAQHS